MSLRRPTTLFPGAVIRTTEAAVLVEEGSDKTWVPRSAIEDGDAVEVGCEDLQIENWWLRKNGHL